MFSLLTVVGIIAALGTLALIFWLHVIVLGATAFHFTSGYIPAGVLILLIGGVFLVGVDFLYIDWLQALNYDVSMIGK